LGIRLDGVCLDAAAQIGLAQFENNHRGRRAHRAENPLFFSVNSVISVVLSSDGLGLTHDRSHRCLADRRKPDLQ